MVYTNPIELSKNHEEAEEDIIAAVLSENIESIPEDNYFRHGYELLPQEPEMIEDIVNDAAFKEINEQDKNFFCHMRERSPEVDQVLFDGISPSSNSLPLSIPEPNEIVTDVWFDSSPSDIGMDSEKVEEVKQVMVNITLPLSAIPEWAANVPEEQWKEYLLNRLHIKQNKKQV